MIDISSWKRDERSQASGTRSKFWLINSEIDSKNPPRHLFKVPTEGTGGHWAEYIASRVGRQLGFLTAEVELAIYKGALGTISKNFRGDAEEFFEGGDLFLARFENFDRHSLTYYELPCILEILSDYELKNEFFSIPVFDALIANNDRHCDNWGVLNGPRGIRLAPIYDNGSSLGFNVLMEDKKKMLTDLRMLEGFCNRGKPNIGLPNKRKPKHLELLSFLHQSSKEALEVEISKLEILDEKILRNIVNDISKDIMSDLEKEWIVHLLIFRKNWILDWLERRF